MPKCRIARVQDTRAMRDSDGIPWSLGDLGPEELALYHRWEALDRPVLEISPGVTAPHLGRFLSRALPADRELHRAKVSLWLASLEGK